MAQAQAEAPIFRAAREGNEGEVIRLLDENLTLLEAEDSFAMRLRRRGYVSLRNRVRPLMRAARFGQLGMVRLLVRRGADIHATDSVGETALHYAAGEGRGKVVTILLNQGAEANIRSFVMGRMPLMVAAWGGCLGVVRLLVQHMGIQGLDERDDNGRTALHYVVEDEGCAEVVNRNSRLKSPLTAEVVRFLLFAGADPTIRDSGGRTPRTLAQEMGDARSVAVFEWWDGELKHRALLYRAISLHKAYTTQRDQPTSQVPTYLEARVAAGHAVPGVEVVSPQSEHEKEEEEKEKEDVDDNGRNEAAGEEERHAMLEYVVKGLNEELVTELLEGFHGP